MTMAARPDLAPVVATGRYRRQVRRHLRKGTSLEAFFADLEGRGVRYVVLRWFDTLPDVEPGEDVDMLVADEDIDALAPDLAAHRLPPRRQKFDVYSVSGLPGSDFQGIPYYPEPLASGLIERSVLLHGRYRVPCPQDHFDSLAFHAVYHKGERSGLPADKKAAASGEPAGATDHDYAAVLGRLADELDLDVEITLEGLDAHLAGKGLRPPLDTLDKLAQSNDWLRRHLETQFGPVDAGFPGLSVFVLRERALPLLDLLLQEMRAEGWEPLETVLLDPDAARRAGVAVRGGNWAIGPWPVAGGGPAAYVIGYDRSAALGVPMPPGRVEMSKAVIRHRLLRGLAPEARYNPLHSSDDPRQAFDYLDVLEDPEVVARVRAGVARVREEMTFPYPVVEVLPTKARRAVVAVVRHPEYGECVCKLFHPWAVRYLHRELRARTAFAHIPEVPRLLEAGDRWLISPRYTDTGAHVRRRLPGTEQVQLASGVSLALARLARELHRSDTFLLDLTSQNLLTDPAAGLKVLDWEYLQEFAGDRPPLAASPTVLGRADGEPLADTPMGEGRRGRVYITAFSPLVTGLPVRLLLARPVRPLAWIAEPAMVAVFAVRAAGRVGVWALRSADRTARGGVRAVLYRIYSRR